MRPRGRRPAALALFATMTLVGCASQARYSTDDYAGDRPVAIEVSNNNWMDVVIYAVSAGNRVRLGGVTTGFAKRFSVPRSVNVQSGDFHLQAHPVGSDEVFSSDYILVSPGQRIVWSIENQLGLSSYRVASGK